MRRDKKWFWAGMISIMIFNIVLIPSVESQEKYPNKPIEIYIPIPMGAGFDLGTRTVASYLKEKWGVPVTVVNKPGGKMIPGVLEFYKRATPDGYIMMGEDQNTTSLMQITEKNLPFNIMDRTFIAMYNSSPFVLIVPSASPIKTLQDLIAVIKKNPESISYTSMGGSGANEMPTKQLFAALGVDIKRARPVLVQGGGPAVILAAGNNVSLACSSASGVIPSVQAGTVRALAVTSKNRWLPELADVPTTSELGYPSVNCVSYTGISGPPKLPSSIVSIWEKAIQDMAKDPEYISKFKKIGGVPTYMNSQDFRALIAKEVQEFSKLIQ